jgi:hypothetical protein
MEVIEDEDVLEPEVPDQELETPEDDSQESPSPQEPEPEEPRIPKSRLDEVIAERNQLREERQRLLDRVLTTPTETKTGEVDPDADIKGLGYEPDYMTDNEKAIARNQAADRKLMQELIADKKTSAATQQYNQNIQLRYSGQIETISECEEKPLTDTQRNEILQHALRLAPTKTDKSPEQLATLAVAEWKKSRSRPAEKIKSDKTSVAEPPSRGSGPTRGSIPAGGNMSLEDALDAAAKAMGYTGN